MSRAHWHGEIVVRMIQPNPKVSQVEFLNQFQNQVCSNDHSSDKIKRFFPLGISLTQSSTRTFESLHGCLQYVFDLFPSIDYKKIVSFSRKSKSGHRVQVRLKQDYFRNQILFLLVGFVVLVYSN